MYRRLSDDVSRSEMLRLREEEKMSNQSIADMLGVSKQTVYRAIGPQGKEIRRAPVRGGKPKPYNEPKVEAVEEVPACLVVANRLVDLEGMVGHYTVDPKSKKVRICMENGSGMMLEFERFETFVDELSAIKRKLGELKVENEMW